LGDLPANITAILLALIALVTAVVNYLRTNTQERLIEGNTARLNNHSSRIAALQSQADQQDSPKGDTIRAELGEKPKQG